MLRLIADGKVLRGNRTYALAGTQTAFVPTRDAIVAALTNGADKSSRQIAEEIRREIWSVQRQLRHHLVPEGVVIFTRRDRFTLAGSRPAYVPTRNAIIKVLRRRKEVLFADMVKARSCHGPRIAVWS
jgi:hypothetical protein